MLNIVRITLALCLIGAAVGYGYQHMRALTLYEEGMLTPQTGMEADMARMAEAIVPKPPSYEGSSAAGSYLSGRFAQRHHDWQKAGRYIDYVIEKDAENSMLLKRAMVLAMGAGNYDRAFEIAQTIVDTYEEDNALSHMFLAAHAFKEERYDDAANAIKAMPEDGLSSFIMPLLYGWSSASLGRYDVENLRTNSIHLYHAILIAEYMNQRDAIKDMLKQVLGAGEISAEDIERIADIYAHIEETDNAIKLYEQALIFDPDNVALLAKLETARSGEKSDIFMRVRSPAQGVAEAFYDMARLLAQDYSDESARIFSRIAVYLAPELAKPRFLLARVAARNDRFDEAITLYNGVNEEDENYLQAQRNAADILHEQGRSEEAIKALENLFDSHDDLESLLQIGDIHRIDEDYKSAIKAYDRVFKVLRQKSDEIGSEYWHLYYVRGMSHEQNGNWLKAEKDLQTALDFEPDHPYILNYLGYAWADQGENLEKALEMIERAAELRPGDGYITDSLGWVYYRMGRFAEAVPVLEQAVELMPYDPVINDHLGDAYWKVGRKLEAEFQWVRAKNHSEDDELIATIENKLVSGLDGAMTAQDETQEPSEMDINAISQDNTQAGETEIQ